MRRMVLRAFGAAIVGCGLCQMAWADPIQVTIDPSALGLGGSAFAADALTGGEVSRISNDPVQLDGSFTWHEHGFLQVTGATVNGSGFVPVGLNIAYTMYFGFDIDGFQPSLLSPGYATAASMNMYMVNGVSSFGFDGSNIAFVNNGANAPTLVASLSGLTMTTGANIVNFAPLALDLNASLFGRVDTTPSGDLAIASPAGPFRILGTFFHSSDGVQVLNGGQAFLVTGGNDTLSFDVPEPSGLLVVALGMVGIAALRGQRPANAA